MPRKSKNTIGTWREFELAKRQTVQFQRRSAAAKKGVETRRLRAKKAAVLEVRSQLFPFSAAHGQKGLSEAERLRNHRRLQHAQRNRTAKFVAWEEYALSEGYDDQFVLDELYTPDGE